jgi:predicted transcriptional regulator
MADLELTLVQKLYLEALKEGPQESSKLVNMVKNKLTELKGGNNPVGATARSQAVLDELEKNGYIKVVAKKLFGGKTYDITDKGRNAIG